MIADYIKLRPDRIGWTLLIYTNGPYSTEEQVHEFTVGDVIQFTEETERTLGRWLADGPADFHNEPIGTDDAEAVRLIGEAALKCADGIKRAIDPDLVRDLERGK